MESIEKKKDLEDSIIHTCQEVRANSVEAVCAAVRKQLVCCCSRDDDGIYSFIIRIREMPQHRVASGGPQKRPF